MGDPVTLLLLLIGVVIVVLALTGRLGEAQNIIVTVILFVVLLVLLRWAGVL